MGEGGQDDELRDIEVRGGGCVGLKVVGVVRNLMRLERWELWKYEF